MMECASDQVRGPPINKMIREQRRALVRRFSSRVPPNASRVKSAARVKLTVTPYFRPGQTITIRRITVKWHFLMKRLLLSQDRPLVDKGTKRLSLLYGRIHTPAHQSGER